MTAVVSHAAPAVTPGPLVPPPRRPESQERILARWPVGGAPLVSILCHAYNQEHYIGAALDGFLSQDTDFPFEVIVHDDCSTDSTVAIIKDYAARYPAIIHPIYQTQNQFSQGRKPPNFTFPKARGTYLALCEGDDYWLDPLKLKKQVQALRRTGRRLSIHPAVEITVDGRTLGYTGVHAGQETIIGPAAFIEGGGDFCPTASLMVHRDGLASLPDWLLAEAPVMDYFYQMLWSRDGALYLPDVMSVYRRGGASSWSRNIYVDPLETMRHYTRLESAMTRLRPILNEDRALDRALARCRFEGAKWALRGGALGAAWALAWRNLLAREGRNGKGVLLILALCCPPLARHLLNRRRASLRSRHAD